MPVAQVLENYNSCMIQKSSFCENNYYKSLRFEKGIKQSWINGSIYDRDGNDITQMVADAEKYLLENSY
ncbi:MAG: hypothetical protein EOM40_19490 [Clostridia bacterium]|nr:hypothetical protein [Clostridia bacterium]